MRKAPVAIVLMLALMGALWMLPGCQEQPAEQQQPVEDVIPPAEDGAEPADDDAAEADETEAEEGQEETPADGQEEAVDGDDELSPEAEQSREPQAASPAQTETALDMEVNYDRAYSETDFRSLQAVLRLGNEKQKQEARRTLEQLLLNSNVAATRANAASSFLTDPAGSEDVLTEAALDDPEKIVRQKAIEALARAPSSPELLEALRKAQNADDPEVRNTALMAEMDVRLKSMEPGDDTSWVARLLARNRDDASAQLQIKLVQRGTNSLPAVIDVLANAPQEHARSAAACTIAMICAGTNPRQQEFAELSQAMMKEGLAKPEPANLDGLEPLENALKSDPSWKVRAIAAQGLGYLGQESSAPILGEALHDEHEEVRWWAALALETVPGEAALEDLAEAATEDEAKRVRAAAVRALGWIDSDRVVRPLIRATADFSSVVRQAAAEELARTKSAASLQALVNLFDDPSEDVRWAAVVAAGQLRDEETVPALIEAMNDPSPMVANAAERALQRMGKAERRFGLESET